MTTRSIAAAAAAILTLILSDQAAAEDVTVGLAPGDGFAVEDDGGTDRLRVDGSKDLIEIDWATSFRALSPSFGGDAEPGQVAVHITASPGVGATRPLAICRAGSGRCSFANSDGAYFTNAYIVIDGSVLSAYDPETGVLNITEWGFIDDPDGPGTLATMAQFGADVEMPMILRGNRVSVNGRPPKLLLGLDWERDWVYKVDVDGTQCWGDPNEKGFSSWDVCLERVNESGFEYPRFTLDADGESIPVDIRAPLVQGTGAPTHGPAYWGISDGGALDSGDELCATASLVCEDVLDFATVGSPADASCATQHVNGVKFLALCR